MVQRPADSKSVWLVEKHVAVRDPRTGRKRAARRAIVRWIEGATVRERTFVDPISAGAFAAAKIEELKGAGAPAPDSSDLTFSQWKDAYLSARYPEYAQYLGDGTTKVKDTYLRTFMRASELFVERVGNRPLCTYRPTDFDRFRARLQAEGKHRPATVEGFLMRMKTIFRAAEGDGLLARSPKIKVKQVLYEKPGLDPAQINEIFKAARVWPRENRLFSGATTGRIYPILVTLYYTALRVGELIHLTWDDVRRDKDGRIIEILIQPKEWFVTDRDGARRRLRWQPKDREIRAIPAHPALAEVLDEMSRTGLKGWVFTNTKGEQWKHYSLDSFMTRFEMASGFKLGFHIWRRSALTHLHDAGVPPGHVQAIAGHSSLLTTMKYVRKNAAGTAAAILALKIGD